jgi:hypothetical protein
MLCQIRKTDGIEKKLRNMSHHTNLKLVENLTFD